MPMPALVAPERPARKHEDDPNPTATWRPEYGVTHGHTRCVRCGTTWPTTAAIPAGDCEPPGAAFARMLARDERTTR